MTVEQFNNKYREYLETGHYGLAINNIEFIKVPNFKYTQIKAKFGMGRFYAEGISQDDIYEVEQKITELCKKN